MNFMGLGFSFGARDAGLESTLGQLNTQFAQLNDTLQALQATSAEALTPSESLTQSMSDQLADVQKEVGDGLDLDEALDTSGSDKATDAVDGLGDALGGLAKKSKGGSTMFGRMANEVLGGAGKITGAMGWVGMAIGPIISGFGSAAEAAGGMVEAISGVPSRVSSTVHSLANDGINLTHSLEAEAVAMGQTARQVGANMGYTGQSLRRFIGRATGMAMGLNIGAEEAARSIRAWDESAEELGATGLQSARDVARLTAGLGINADVLRNSTLEMRHLGASDEQIHRITSALTLMGQRTGDVSGAIETLPDLMQMLERRRALGDTPEQMAAFAADTAAAARGLFAFTDDSDRARSMAAELAGTVTESREAFQNMFAGAEDQLPQLVTELAVVSGDVDQAFDLMSQGPGGLIQGMGQLLQSTRQQGGDIGRVMEFMRGRLQQVFGADMTATLIGFWRTMDSETVAAMDEVRNASVDLAQLGRDAHTTGRTLDEVFERMRGGFQVAFRRVGRQETRDFVRDTGRQLRRLRSSMEDAASSGGALGQAMRTLSLSSQIGGLALLPRELRSSAIAADEMQGMVTPLIRSFSTWGGLVETVGTYVALFVTEVVMARREFGTWGQAIDNVSKRFADVFIRWIGQAENFLTNLADRFGSFNWADLFGGDTRQGGVIGAFQRVLSRLRDVDWGRIWKGLSQGFQRLFAIMEPWLTEKWNQIKDLVRQLIQDWWADIDWSGVGSEIVRMGGVVLAALRPVVMRIGYELNQWFMENWDDILLGIVRYWWEQTTENMRTTFGALQEWFTGSYIPWWTDIWEGLWDRLTSYIDDTIDTWRDVFRNAGTIFRNTWTTVTSFFRVLWENVTTAVSGYFTGIGESIRGSIGAAVDSVRQRWDSFVSALSGVWEGLSAGWQTFLQQGEAFWESLTGLPERIRGGWQGMVEFFRTMFASIRQVVGEDLAQAGEFFERLANVGSRALRFIMGTADEEFGNSIHTVVGEDMAATEALMTETAMRVSAIIEQVLHDATIRAIVGGFTTGFEQVVEGMESFTETMRAAFESLAEGILGIMTGLFTTVIDQAHDTMLATETAVESIVGRLRTVTAAQSQLTGARAEAVAGGLAPADEAALERRLAAIRSNAALTAINMPLWYDGPGQYREQFDRRMNDLIRAVRESGVGSAEGTLAERRALLMAARAGVAGAGRVGGTSEGSGHPRVRRPGSGR